MFIKLTQGNMTVAQYKAEFSRLAKFAPTMVVDEEAKAQRFEDGLRFRIKQGVVPFELTTFRAVVSKALLVEMGHNKAQANRDNNHKKRPRQGEHSSSFQAKK